MTKIKFPIVKDVEYLDVTKNKQILKSYNGAEIDNLSWREVQYKIGDEIGTEFYHYILKFKKSDQLHKGLVRGVLKDGSQKVSNNSDIELIKNSINQLNQKPSLLKTYKSTVKTN